MKRKFAEIETKNEKLKQDMQELKKVNLKVSQIKEDAQKLSESINDHEERIK